MYVSQKGQYTLRALFELAKRRDGAPVTATQIAEAQAIPPRFVEVILQNLKNAGAVVSRRGSHGGYALAGPPEGMTVAEILRLAEGSLAPVACVGDETGSQCRLKGQCVFAAVWTRAMAAVEQVYETTTLKDLVCTEQGLQEEASAADYCI